MIHHNFCIFISLCVCLTLVLATVTAKETCDKNICDGPLGFYESVGCKPIYSWNNTCCPERYDCDHLENLNKCYLNNHGYEIGDKLREDDEITCQTNCTCTKGVDNFPFFSCHVRKCCTDRKIYSETCYAENSPRHCCRGRDVCVKSIEDLPLCNVDGKIYSAGEYFIPEDDPYLYCVCLPGYRGENIEPFCKRFKRRYCLTDLHLRDYLVANCIPIYESNVKPYRGCINKIKCVDTGGALRARISSKRHDLQCKFSNLLMRHGEEYHLALDVLDTCIICVCEVPPVPTCRRLKDDECRLQHVLNWPYFS